MDFALEIIKILAPAILVLLMAYYMLNSFFNNALAVKDKELQMKKMELELQNRQEALPIRLQAYERLVLFLERINPQSLISRLRQDGMTSPELQFAMVSSIRVEYEHNITQQLYVSSEAWTLAQASTEELISIINQIGASQGTDATGTDLSRSILEYFIGNNIPIPTDKAIAQLQDEVKLLF
jgi:hypothetical protein